MRRRRIFLLLAATVTLLVAGTYVVLVHTGASQVLVESVLARFIRSRFGLRNAKLDPAAGRVRLEGVQIAHPKNDQLPVLIADRIDLDVNTNPLGEGAMGQVRRIVAEKLSLHVSLLEGERFDLQEILDLEPSGAPGSSAFPAVTITDSTVTVSLTEDRPAVEFRAVQLDLQPEAAPSQRIVVSGSMISPSGFSVRIQGSADPGKRELQLLLESEDVRLGPAVARPFSRDAEELLAQAGFAGVARRVALWLQHPAEPGDDAAVTARLSAELEHVECTPPQFPYPFAEAAGRVTASTRDGGHVHFDLSAQSGQARLAGRGDLTGLLAGKPVVDAAIQASAVPADEQLRKALQAIKPAREVWAAFQPAGGEADVDLRVHDGPDVKTSIAMDLALRGVGGSFHGFPSAATARPVAFPYRLDSLDGVVHVRQQQVRFGPILGTRSDGARIEIAGQVDGIEGPAAGQVLDVTIQGEGVRFSTDLRNGLEALVAGGGAIYDSYAPEGQTDLKVRVHRGTADPAPDVRVVLTPKACSAAFAGFPYRLERLQGNVDIDAGSVAFSLAGEHAAAAVGLGGRFVLGPPLESGLQSELWVDGRGIALDGDLRTALGVLDPELVHWWERLSPTGTIDCRLTLWRPAGASEPSHDLELELVDGSITEARFDRRIEKLAGSVFVHGTGPRGHVDISVLRGEIPQAPGVAPARVIVEGSLESAAGRESIALTTLVRGLHLDDGLRRSLDRAKVMSQASWDWLRPSGTVDVLSRHHKGVEQDDTTHELLVQLRDVRSACAVLPMPATGITGELAVVDESGTFYGLQGRIGDAEVRARSGGFQHRDGQTTVEVVLDSESMTVDESFAKLATGPLQRAFLERRIHGALRLQDVHMSYRFPDAGSDFELDFRGQVVARDLDLELGVPVRGLHGVLVFDAGQVTPRGGSIKARVDNLSMLVLGHRVDELDAAVLVEPDETAFAALSARLHGGTIAGAGPDGHGLTISLDGSDRISAHLRCSGLSLAEMLRAAGDAAPAARGTLEGEIQVAELRSTDLPGMQAAGRFRVSNGRLGAVPIFTAIYSYLAPKNRPQFDGIELRFEIGDGRIRIDDLVMKSPLVEVTGSGWIGLDGYLDVVLEFPDFFASASDWLILPRLLQTITSQVVRFQVYGWLRAPRARPRWLFQDAPERLRVEPIPAPRLPAPRPRF